MRFSILIATTLVTVFSTVSSWAGGQVPPGVHAPEIGDAGSLAALIAVGAFAAVIWERRRRR